MSRPINRPIEARNAEIVIERLGARGDGIGQLGGTPVFVPLTLPGERVLARIEGKRGDGLTASVLEWLLQDPARAKPPCRHFGICGGCAAQHMNDKLYVAWKRGIAVEALSRVGVPEERIAPLMRVSAHTRRRASFAFRRTRDGVLLGFNARASHQLVDVGECPLLHPDLESALPGLRLALNGVLTGDAQGDIALQLTESGLDALITCDLTLDLFKREKLAVMTEQANLARISWRRHEDEDPEPVSERHAPIVTLGGVAVHLPPGVFLQPSREGEAAITAQVMAGLSGLDGPVADLYAGVGSFSLPLAACHPVHAVDGHAQAVAALKQAGDRIALGRLTTERRDLSKRPLLVHELKKFSGVVIDPPRAGAREQVTELAMAATVQKTVMVSCNPATMARDLSILINKGWRLDSVVPIDQFLWTPHLELTAILHQTIKKS